MFFIIPGFILHTYYVFIVTFYKKKFLKVEKFYTLKPVAEVTLV